MRTLIIEHVELGPRAKRILLESPEIARSAAPGQFAHVLCTPTGSGYDPLLRRPLSIHDADPYGRITLLYEIRGRGTALLAERRPGQTLDLLGPLGNGFVLPESSQQPLLLVAGGIAVAPLYFLARRIADTVGCERTTFFIGARTATMLLCLDEFARLGSDLRVATDDGTRGYHGFVPGLMQEYLEAVDKANPPLVYACGPMPMLKAVSEITKAHGLECQVSLEAKMACGVGACMSCVVRVRSGESSKYVCSCKDGPVFDADEVIWEF